MHQLGAEALGPDCAPGFAGFLVATPDRDAASSVGGLAALLPLEESGVDAAGGPDCAPGLDGFFVATPARDAAASVGGLPALLLLSGDAVEAGSGAEAGWAWAVNAMLEHASSSASDGGEISLSFVMGAPLRLKVKCSVSQGAPNVSVGGLLRPG
jgi:hypothetical protein